MFRGLLSSLSKVHALSVDVFVIAAMGSVEILAPFLHASRSDSSVIENYVLALKFSSGKVTEDIKEYSAENEMCLIWSNFEFAFREKLACLDIFYRVINVY